MVVEPYNLHCKPANTEEVNSISSYLFVKLYRDFLKIYANGLSNTNQSYKNSPNS